VRFLLDTHVLVWAAVQPSRLPKVVRAAIEDADVRLISAASAYEIGFKHGIGKLPGGSEILANWQPLAAGLLAEDLPLTVSQMAAAGALRWEHRDPFDRMLVAQAQTESLTLVTADRRIRSFGDVRTYWA